MLLSAALRGGFNRVNVSNERSEWAVNTNLHTSIAKLGPSA
jgi:hypothetical protein